MAVFFFYSYGGKGILLAASKNYNDRVGYQGFDKFLIVGFENTNTF